MKSGDRVGHTLLHINLSLRASMDDALAICTVADSCWEKCTPAFFTCYSLH